jgi:hypothetical protein
VRRSESVWRERKVEGKRGKRQAPVFTPYVSTHRRAVVGVYPPAHTQNFNSPRSLCARTHIHTACRRIHPYRSPPPTHPHFNNESQSTQKPDHHMDTTDGFNRAGGQGCNGVGIRVNEATAGLMTASPSAPDTHGPQRRVMSRVCESPCVCVCVTRVSCTMQV